MNILQKKIFASSQNIFISAYAQCTRKFLKHEFWGENEKIGKIFVNTKYPHAYMVYEKTKKNTQKFSCLSVFNITNPNQKHRQKDLDLYDHVYYSISLLLLPITRSLEL